MKTHFTIHVLSLLIVSSLYSCKPAKLGDTEEKQRIGEYYEIAAIYRRVYTETSPKKRDLRDYITYRVAEYNRLINNTGKATSAYMNAIRYDYLGSTVYLRTGQMLQRIGCYPEAVKNYDIYIGSDSGNLLAIDGIQRHELAPGWKKNPTRYGARRVDEPNSHQGEFNPMLAGDRYDQLCFASSCSKDRDTKVSAIIGQNNNNLFPVEQDEKGTWLAPVELEDEVNMEYDEGTPSLSPDGDTMYYTYCARDPKGPHTVETYVSIRSSVKWGKGTRATTVKDSVTALGHPSTPSNGKYLCFVSDTVGDFGGKGTSRARVVGSDFGPMESLEEEINIPGDGMFPYVWDSVILYLASNGRSGVGGLDLFKVTQDSTRKWKVGNLGAPINSIVDDSGIIFTGEEEQGFLCSDHSDARSYNHIYPFERLMITIFTEGIVNDVDEHLIEDATVRIIRKDGLNVRVPVRKDGTYRVESERDIRYVMIASARGYLNQSYESHTDPKEKNETYIANFLLFPISRPVVIDNIFCDFDKATLRPESEKALGETIKMLNDNPNVAIELDVHTGWKGMDQHNERLTQRRMQSVVDYLIAGGTEAARLEVKGYGESVPEMINRRMAKQFDLLREGDMLTEESIFALPPEQQEITDQINHRTEFKVLHTNYSLF